MVYYIYTKHHKTIQPYMDIWSVDLLTKYQILNHTTKQVYVGMLYVNNSVNIYLCIICIWREAPQIEHTKATCYYQSTTALIGITYGCMHNMHSAFCIKKTIVYQMNHEKCTSTSCLIIYIGNTNTAYCICSDRQIYMYNIYVIQVMYFVYHYEIYF